jgi:hypothetical protein
MLKFAKTQLSHPKFILSPFTFYVLRFTFYGSTHIALYLFLFALYLLTYTPRINSSDGLAMFATAESLARRGQFDIEQIRWMDLQQGSYGLDSLLYSRKGIGLPVALLPLTWLGLLAPGVGPVSVSLLFNAMVTALTAVILRAYVQRLGYNRRTGLLVALIFGLATLAWPYAKSLFSDPFAGFLLLTSAYLLLKFHQANFHQNPGQQDRTGEPQTEPASLPLFSQLASLKNLLIPLRYLWMARHLWMARYPFLTGLLLGWNVATRYAEALFIPVFVLLLLYYLWLDHKRRRATRAAYRSFLSHFWPPLLAFATPLLVIGLGLMIFNITRYGDPLNTGYLPEETFGGALWDGVTGQLLSPGRGLWLYSPVLTLSLGGVLPFYRRHRAEAWLTLAIIGLHLILYGKWFMWHGGFAWGPRFMIPTLPFWALLLAPPVSQVFPPADILETTPKNISPMRSLERPNPQSPIPNPQSPIPNLQCVLWNAPIPRLAFIFLITLSLIPQFLMVAIDFSPFQNDLLDTGLPLFARQTFFDPEYSPLLKAWRFISSDTLDLAWAWQGRFNGQLLSVLLINIAITGLNLKKQLDRRQTIGIAPISTLPLFHSSTLPLFHLLAYLSTLTALILLLTYTHTLPAKPLQEAVTVLNQFAGPTDAIITNDPESGMPFAELYKGRAPVLGLNQGGFPLPGDIESRLSQITAHHPRIWWLPNWLPPEASAIEQTLLASGFRVRSDVFDGQRLVLFAYPQELRREDILPGARFGPSVHLVKVAYMPDIPAGAALPIELYWQTTTPLAENYHVFIHLLNTQGQIVTQTDGQPGQWSRPTASWKVEETIIDRHALWISPETSAGRYQLLIGLYRPADGQRLYLPDGADSLKLEIEITPGNQ